MEPERSGERPSKLERRHLMLNLWKDFDRIGVPSLFGWVPSRVLDNLTSFGGASPVEVEHEGDHVVITADMPGVDPKDLDVTFENGTVRVVGLRGGHQYSFSVYLGNDYDGDRIEAELDKGVVTLKAEMRPEAKPRKIALKGVEAKRLASGESK
jgi:HSP20 family protein